MLLLFFMGSYNLKSSFYITTFADEAATQPWPEPRLVREASRLYNLTTVSCGSTHCVALGRCNERIDLCGVCGGDDSTCFLGDREVAQALQMSAALESQAA